jgi:hypothetical protein
MGTYQHWKNTALFSGLVDGGDARSISDSTITRALKELGHFTYGFPYYIVHIPAERLWI